MLTTIQLEDNSSGGSNLHLYFAMQIFPTKTKVNHYCTPPFLLPLTNLLCIVVCQH